MEQGQIQDAIQEFETAVKLSANQDLSPANRRFRSSALLNLGFAYIASKDYPKALMSFERANQSDPAMVEQTIETYSRSLAATASEGIYLKLSLLLRAKGKDGEAASVLQNALNANPEYADARQLLTFLNGNQK